MVITYLILSFLLCPENVQSVQLCPEHSTDQSDANKTSTPTVVINHKGSDTNRSKNT